ncbi:hypothetical protein SAMN06265375_10264 [Muriicola jejuensis]|nr:hypothetical protein SAMN06265375_10264 [Muriicola jejuensis]
MGYISKTEEVALGLIEKGADRPFFPAFYRIGFTALSDGSVAATFS